MPLFGLDISKCKRKSKNVYLTVWYWRNCLAKTLQEERKKEREREKNCCNLYPVCQSAGAAVVVAAAAMIWGARVNALPTTLS